MLAMWITVMVMKVFNEVLVRSLKGSARRASLLVTRLLLMS